MQGVYRQSAHIDQHSASYFAYVAGCSRRRRVLAFARGATVALLAVLLVLPGAALVYTLSTPPVARAAAPQAPAPPPSSAPADACLDDLEEARRCNYHADCHFVCRYSSRERVHARSTR